MNDTPETTTPSRRRGRPPKVKLEPPPILAPPQEPVIQEASSASPEFTSQAPTVPSPLPPLPPLPTVTADGVDLRETPAMAARHSQSSGSDSDGTPNALGGLDVPSIDAGTVLVRPTPALPEQSQALPVQERIPESEHGSNTHSPAAPVQLQARQTNVVPIQVNDVVQVNNRQSKFYGTLFIVGDIRKHRVHGCQIGANGKMEYYTVNEDECIHVGSMARGQVRSRNCCSAKWKADGR